MKLKAKDIDISSGGPLVAVVNHEDAAMLDLHVMDRIKLKKGSKIETAVVDIAQSSKVVPKGRIGVFEEVINSLRLKNNDAVDISVARKPLSIDYIKKKLDGQRLSKNEIDQIVWDIVHNKHSIGGIPGNRTTLVIVPIIAAAGYFIPKTSSRSITSAAGTADTME